MKDKVVCGLTDRWRWTVVYKRKSLRDNIRLLLRFPLLLSPRKYTGAFSKMSNPLTSFSCKIIPVSQEGTDDILGIVGDLHIIWKIEGVLVVHDFTVCSHQRVCVERRVT